MDVKTSITYHNFQTASHFCIKGTHSKTCLKNENFPLPTIRPSPKYQAQVLIDQNMVPSIIYWRQTEWEVFCTL